MTRTLNAGVASDAYPIDAAFPQLAVANDPARMLALFREHLHALPGKALQIVDCVPFRFRCRQSGSRCVLQYTLRLLEPGTGRQWDQWVTALIYAESGEAERTARKLRAGDPAGEIPEAWQTFEPVCEIPELDMVVVVFPFDRRVPQLGRVLAQVSRALDPLLLARLGPGRWEARAPWITPSRYRTELGAVLRYALPARDLETGRSEIVRCYVKVYRNDRGRETFGLLKGWVQGARPYALTAPIAYLEELGTMVLEEAPGKSLQQILLEGRDPVTAVRSVARAVAAFNQDRWEVGRRHTLADQVEQLKRASALVQWACPDMRAQVRGITAAVVNGLTEVPAAPFHGDLKPDHVFLSEGRVIFIDLDSVSLGDPVRDPAHFCSYVAAGVGLDALPAAQWRALARDFTQEYFAHVPYAWRRQYSLHLAGALVEVACGIFRHQGPWWLEKAEAAIEEAHQALAGVSPISLREPVEYPADRSPSAPRLATSSLTGRSVALLRILWSGGEATVEKLAASLDRPLTRSTVRAMLQRLEEEGFIRHRIAERLVFYRAAVGQADVQRSFVANIASFADGLFEGDTAALVCQLLRARDVTGEDLARVIDLLGARGRELDGGSA